MSIHRSLASRSKLKRQRNVLSRVERIEKMVDQGRWNAGDTVFGLPALKVLKIKTGKEKKKEKETEEAAATGAGGAAAAPAEK